MKLKSKSRDKAKVHRTYSPAKTPFQRIAASDVVTSDSLAKLEHLRQTVDPVTLLRAIQALQDAFWRHANQIPPTESDEGAEVLAVTFDVETCSPRAGITASDQQGPKPSPRRYRKASKPRKSRKYRTRKDPFEAVDGELHRWFLAAPQSSAKSLLKRLQENQPDSYPDRLLRTLQRKVSKWRAAVHQELISPWHQDTTKTSDDPPLR